MNALTVAAGTLIVIVIVWDVFRDIVHPGDRGTLSVWIARGLFNLLRQRSTWRPAAGPLALVLLIVAWVFALVLGFALVYHGGARGHFGVSTGAPLPDAPSFLRAVYFS